MVMSKARCEALPTFAGLKPSLTFRGASGTTEQVVEKLNAKGKRGCKDSRAKAHSHLAGLATRRKPGPGYKA